MVEEGYETFTQKVADNRGMKQDDVKAIAGGRVWSGEQAKENGLVDIIGSFDDAIQLAAEEAGVADDYRVSYYPRQKPFLEEFLDKMAGSIKTRIIGTEVDPVLKQLERVKNLQGLQARMGGDLEIN